MALKFESIVSDYLFSVNSLSWIADSWFQIQHQMNKVSIFVLQIEIKTITQSNEVNM